MREYTVICLMSGDKGTVKAESSGYARLRFAQRVRHKFPMHSLAEVVQMCSAQVKNPQRGGGRPRKYGLKWGE